MHHHTVRRVAGARNLLGLGLLALGLFAAAAPASADNYTGPPTPCDKELSVQDAVPILVGKATITHYSMSASSPEQGCQFGVIGNADTIGLIDFAIQNAGVPFFQNMLSFQPAGRNPIPGVGDEAYGFPSTDSNIPGATETDIYARKGTMTCIVQLHRSNGAAGAKLIVPQTDADIAVKLGALCQKVFLARAGK